MVHLSGSLLGCALLLVSDNALQALGVVLSRAEIRSQLALLNTTVDGRLHEAVPWELPCFSEYNGESAIPDEAACAAIQANYTSPFERVQHFGTYMMPQWGTCQVTRPTGECLLNVTNPEDSAAYTGVNCSNGDIPSYYVDVRYPADVQAVIAFSNATGVRLSVKNKGHDYKGRSSGKNTLSLWVTNLNTITHDTSFTPEGCTTSYDALTIGPGAITEDILEYVDSINRTFVGGYHQTVGAGGGYFLGGGHSVLSPVYGLAVDRVVQAKVVTPEGLYLVANECQNSDLFFALRGGGGSAFGVVIESTHRLEPQLTLQVASISFVGHSNSRNLAQWYSLLVNETYKWGTEGWGGHITGPSLIYVTPLLSNAEAHASMQATAEFALAQGGTAVVEEVPSYLAFFSKYVPTAEAGVGTEITLGTRLLSTSLFATEEGRATLSKTIANVLSFASPYIVAGTPFLFNHTVGSTSVTPAWYDSLWHLSVHGNWVWNSTAEDIADQYEAVTQHTQTFRDITPGSGAYFNEGDVYEPEHTEAYWGSNYAKLLSIKQKYDSHGVLDCWQCVGWKGPSDPLYECYIPLSQSS
ncbi:FAD-binding domain-containing protein [Fomitopsis serialis]|uniref:FAD-binding domain-containing protein n=1 Tax=Fomitopsis serialis TaxID=139415 RepID=UPI002007389E|nr:FAD-binding domain-containing protein [Neoantrodia serialis]KAH9932267.1 FAD-binding domain-containing protein [Neoantrodia serialis]